MVCGQYSNPLAVGMMLEEVQVLGLSSTAALMTL
jgi:hypothetical protein